MVECAGEVQGEAVGRKQVPAAGAVADGAPVAEDGVRAGNDIRARDPFLLAVVAVAHDGQPVALDAADAVQNVARAVAEQHHHAPAQPHGRGREQVYRVALAFQEGAHAVPLDGQLYVTSLVKEALEVGEEAFVGEGADVTHAVRQFR